MNIPTFDEADERQGGPQAMSVCAFTSVCQEDACWVPQYLEEVERLSMPFAVHFDRCTDELKRELANHELCVGFTEQDDRVVEFNEMHKQAVLDQLSSKGYRWAMAWDIDETYERDATRKLGLLSGVDSNHVQVYWLNLWEDRNTVRVDGPFGKSKRVKFYNLIGRKWIFTHPITNGAKSFINGQEVDPSLAGPGALDDLVCLHHGMMTKRLRSLHKERWDRIYSTALRGDANPYGFWAYATDESIDPITVKHGYF